MAVTPQQRTKLLELEEQASDAKIDGIFTTVPGQGLSPQKMAMAMWEQGLIPVPTVTALIEAMEKEMALLSDEDAAPLAP